VPALQVQVVGWGRWRPEIAVGQAPRRDPRRREGDLQALQISRFADVRRPPPDLLIHKVGQAPFQSMLLFKY
jgi:hypothetical protein